jgi:hypothetical protein
VQKTDGVTEIPYDRWDVDEYFDPSPNAVGRILGSRALKVTLWERIPSGMLWPLFFSWDFMFFFHGI